MAEEIEVKFLNIDPIELQKKLESIGAKKVDEYFYRRRVFDYPDLRLDKQGAWIRLRDEGESIRLSFKQRLGMSANATSGKDTGMEEIEFSVDDFGKTGFFLEKLGLVEKFYQENKRIRWEKDGTEFDIDFWPELDPYLEIEAPSWEGIDEAISALGLSPEDKKIFSTTQIYELKGIRDKDYQRITFDEMVKKDNLNAA